MNKKVLTQIKTAINKYRNEYKDSIKLTDLDVELIAVRVFERLNNNGLLATEETASDE